MGKERSEGADRRRIGKLLSADGGTVFLDEIQSSSIRFQNSLLRFLDYGEIQPLGSERIERADVRVISASSFNLAELKKSLNEPFFYRISKLNLLIPSFKDRKERESYIHYFLMKECRRMGKEVEIEEEAVEVIVNYPWEGNFRELRSFIHKLVLMKKRIKKEDVLKEMDEKRSFEGYSSAYILEVEDGDLTLEEATRRHIKKSTGIDKGKQK